MAGWLTIVRFQMTCFFCIAVLGTVLNWYLSPFTSFADVPLQQDRRVVSPPALDGMGSTDTKSDNLTEFSLMSQGGRNACFPVKNRAGESVEPLANDDNDSLLLPSTVMCIELFAPVDEFAWPRYEALGDHARSVRNWPEAEQAYVMAVELLDRTAGKSVNQGLASLLNKLGVTRFKQNDFAGAETVFRRALDIYQLTRGADDLHVADTLDLVASALYKQQQGHALAGPLFYRAWAIRNVRLGPNHPAIADSLHHLAVSLYSDNLSLASLMFLRSMEIREKIFGHDHPLVADSLNAMAQLYELHDRRDLAIPLYQDALTIQEKVFGPNASETLQARFSLDMAHRGMDHIHQNTDVR